MVSVETLSGLTIIRPDSTFLDLRNSPDFRREVLDRVPPGTRAILDLDAVVYVDSTGCGVILGCQRHLTGRGQGPGHLKLSVPSDRVRALFAMIRLHQVVEVHASMEAALRSYGCSGTSLEIGAR